MFSKNSVVSIIAVLISQNLVLAAPTSGKSYEVADVLRGPLVSGETSGGYKVLPKSPVYEINETKADDSINLKKEASKLPEVESEGTPVVEPEEPIVGKVSDNSLPSDETGMDESPTPNDDLPSEEIVSDENKPETTPETIEDKTKCTADKKPKYQVVSLAETASPKSDNLLDEKETPLQIELPVSGEKINESPKINPEDQAVSAPVDNLTDASEEIESPESESSTDVLAMNSDVDDEKVDKTEGIPEEEVSQPIETLQTINPVSDDINDASTPGSAIEGPTDNENYSGDVSDAKPSIENPDLDEDVESDETPNGIPSVVPPQSNEPIVPEVQSPKTNKYKSSAIPSQPNLVPHKAAY